MKTFNFHYLRKQEFPTLKNDNGFSIVELTITIVLLSFGILGIYGFFYPATVLTGNFPLHLAANYLTQEGMEVIKNIRDNNILSGKQWSEGLAVCIAGCQLDYKTGTAFQTNVNNLRSYQNTFLNKNTDGLYSYDNGSATLFKRRIITTKFPPNNDSLRIEVVVTWDYRGRTFSSSTIGYIYNY